MSKLREQTICYDDDDIRVLAHIHPASRESIDTVLTASEHNPDGRSQWLWVRLPNGDLILGVFPQGETYEEVERDATAVSANAWS